MAKNNQSDRTRWSRSWIVCGVLYGIFFYWYTAFEGPLTEEEIAYFSSVLESSPDSQDRSQRWQTFMRNDTGDDFAVWNAIDLCDTPLPVAGARPGETSQQVLERYTAPFFTPALVSAGHPVMVGVSAGEAIDLWGVEGADKWA